MPTPAQSFSPWLHRFAVATGLGTLGLILVGGLVTSHGVGMAVPDWPNTYGYNMFLFPVSQWIGGIFYEHTHRLLAALVGLLTTVLAVWLWARETRALARWAGIAVMVAVLALMGVRQMPVYLALAGAAPVVIFWAAWRLVQDPSQMRWWGVMALAGVILQGVLGGLRVVWIADQIGILHGTLAQLFLVLIASMALFTSRFWVQAAVNLPGAETARPDFRVRSVLLGATLLILLQLVLGATMRHQHAGLAIPDFPLAYGRIWPATDAGSVELYNQQRLEVVAFKPITAAHIYLQMTHRLVAFLIFGAVGYAAWLTRRSLRAGHLLSRLVLGWYSLVAAQVLLGAWTIWSNKAADVATLHVLTGSLSLLVGALACILAFKYPFTRSPTVQSALSSPCLCRPEPLASR